MQLGLLAGLVVVRSVAAHSFTLPLMSNSFRLGLVEMIDTHEDALPVAMGAGVCPIPVR